MLNTSKLEEAMQQNKVTKARLCSITGIARTTLDAILNGGDAKISTVETLAKALKLRIGFLFDEEEFNIQVQASGGSAASLTGAATINADNEKMAKLKTELKYLREKLADKEKIISLYEKANK